MKNIILTIVTIISLSAFMSCEKKIEGDGPLVTFKGSITSNVTAINVTSNMKLTLTDTISEGRIYITTNMNIHAYIYAMEHENQFDITLADENFKNLDIQVIASSRRFNKIIASGASNVTVEGYEIYFENYSINLSGASKLDIKDKVDAENYDITASGSSVVNINGESQMTNNFKTDLSGASKLNISNEFQVNSCDITASGSSKVEGNNFISNSLNIDLSGASEVTMGVLESITGKLSGASTVNYWGDAGVAVDNSGSSKVNKIEIGAL